MENLVKRILGEAEHEEREEPREKEHDEKPKADHKLKGHGHQGAPEDSEVDELANLWRTGNKGDVARRFMEMDNETAVKVVFAVGRDGALELARTVDQMLEAGGAEDEMAATEPLEAPSTEPAAVTPPQTDYPARILGRPEV